jgi:putative endonuclease
MSSGRMTRAAVKALDALAKLKRRPPQQELPASAVVGRKGEEEAYFHLRRLGYVMVARNFRSPRRHGEIDLIGWDAETLCFIEVKTRSTREVKPAEAAVDRHKQQDLVAMARDYLRRVAGQPACRFDIVSIYFDRPGAAPDVTLFKNAFPMI